MVRAGEKARLVFQYLFLLCLILMPMRLWAADPVTNFEAQIPNVLNPGLARPLPLQPPAPTAPSGSLGPKAPERLSAIPNAEQIKFELKQVTFEGNTVFSTAQLQPIVQPYLNKTISLNDLQNIANAITKKYWEAGYILSRALLPPQEIAGGNVKIQIVEGYISKVLVAGKPGRAAAQVQSYGNKVLESKPLKESDLERSLLLANDIPGVTVNGVLTPSSNIPQSSDLNLVTQRQIAQGFVSYDNYGTRFLGPQEVTVGGTLNSLLTSGDSTSVRGIMTTHTEESKYAEVTHSELLGPDGVRLLLGGNFSRTLPGSLLEPLDILGISRSLFGDLSYPWVRTRTQNFTVHFSAYYQNLNTSILSEDLYNDRIRSLVAGGYYNSSDSWQGVNTAGLDFSQGMNILGANNGGLRSRPTGRSNFNKFQGNLSRDQFFGSHFSIYAAGQGQYAFTALLASQQFGIGGPDFGRGYDPYEISGDHGLVGKLELRVDTAPDWIILRTVQYYAFLDSGAVWNINYRVSGEPQRAELTSTGLGLRIGVTRFMNANLYIAQPLNRPVASADSVGVNSKAPRGFFQLTASI